MLSQLTSLANSRINAVNRREVRQISSIKLADSPTHTSHTSTSRAELLQGKPSRSSNALQNRLLLLYQPILAKQLYNNDHYSIIHTIDNKQTLPCTTQPVSVLTTSRRRSRLQLFCRERALKEIRRYCRFFIPTRR